MKKLLLLGALGCFSALSVMAKDIFVNTPNTTLLLKAEDGQPLHISYYGERVDNPDMVYRAYSLWEEAYPAFGRGCLDVTALSVKHFDGNMSTEMVYVSDRVTDEPNAKVYTITQRDKVYDFEVDICCRAHISGRYLMQQGGSSILPAASRLRSTRQYLQTFDNKMAIARPSVSRSRSSRL